MLIFNLVCEFAFAKEAGVIVFALFIYFKLKLISNLKSSNTTLFVHFSLTFIMSYVLNCNKITF